ncbi:M23 family metallopeptidase [Thermostaphylospora chromogena]|uniref:Murein DD-endopeptidase MepM and murein hydrolase activator NlpD, contain LysM domain n=1 Tax=Thermostaphylospora chromogena TaxID=35622 RepID=A0A1H1FSX0_9ACTN|nr:M23 family metallopeptidase [Thermostaphylospora chromogena]SDR04112.1 Murein DD-endopeptidase MepM and murein hydrolase activator NlpD, contain LysM domain [Thermostaphylospora chromogena]
MRSRHLTRLAAVAGAALLTSACTSVGGLAGIAEPPRALSAGTSADVSASSADAASRPDLRLTSGWANGGSGSPSGSPTSTPEPSGTPTDGGDADGGDTATEVQRPPAMEPVQVPPPKLSDHTYVFPVRDCEVKYSRKLLVLPKTTIWAERGCAFVSPTDGTVHEVNTTDRWSPATDRGEDREGKFVTVFGKDGVLYIGGHLDSVAKGIKPGVQVKAGQVLGKVGNSGLARSTAPNLYFGISWKTEPVKWWIRRGMVNPWNYLDAWKDGNRTYSPSPEVAALRHKLGKTPKCKVQCGGDHAVTTSQPQQPDDPTPKRTEKPKDDNKPKKKKKQTYPTPEPEDSYVVENPGPTHPF